MKPNTKNILILSVHATFFHLGKKAYTLLNLLPADNVEILILYTATTNLNLTQKNLPQ